MFRAIAVRVAIKCMNEVAEQTATVDVNLLRFDAATPPLPASLPQSVHVHQGAFNPLLSCVL